MRKVKREVLKHDPRGAEDRHATAMTERRISVKPVEDGMSWVGGTLDWTDLTGHHHLVPAATYPIDHTLQVVVPNDNADDPDPSRASEDSDRNQTDPSDEGDMAA